MTFKTLPSALCSSYLGPEKPSRWSRYLQKPRQSIKELLYIFLEPSHKNMHMLPSGKYLSYGTFMNSQVFGVLSSFGCQLDVVVRRYSGFFGVRSVGEFVGDFLDHCGIATFWV